MWNSEQVSFQEATKRRIGVSVADVRWKWIPGCRPCNSKRTIQAHSQDFTLGLQKLSAEGARIKAPRAPRRWGLGRVYPPPLPTRGSGGASWATPFGIFEAHRTLLVERTVLLYWILLTNKARFFRKKKSTQSTIGRPPSGSAPAMVTCTRKATGNKYIHCLYSTQDWLT